jgi:hypothetical protein
LGSANVVVDCPLSPIHDSELFVVRLNVDIQAHNFEAMLHAELASLRCRRKKPLFDLLAPLRSPRTMVLSVSTNEWRPILVLATKDAILSRNGHVLNELSQDKPLTGKGTQNA